MCARKQAPGVRERGLSKKQRKAGSRLAELDQVVVVVEKLVAGGEGLARVDGIPIFVPRSAPGDRLRVRLVERRPDYGRAEIVEILAQGPDRREPPCVHFGSCGGCDLQHLEEGAQLSLKVAAVRETLHRLGGVDEDQAVEVIGGDAWAYRLRTQLHTSGEGNDLKVGYRARRSNQIVEIESCPVLVPDLQNRLLSLRRDLPASPPRRLDFLSGDHGSLSTAPVTQALPHGPITVSVGDFQYELDARCFFQVHRQLLPTLVEQVVGQWRGDRAFDLYAGVGLFSLPLARCYRSVVAVEGDRVSARFVRRNAQRYRFEHVDLEVTVVESWASRMPQRPDRVVVDPPRSGLSNKIRQVLRERRPRRLTYVSCHPAALARDLRVLSDRFEIEKVTVLDMFPQTGHVEVVVQLVS